MNHKSMAKGFRSIADDLTEATELYPEGTLNMVEGRVSHPGCDGVSPHQCGTSHCFAGWWGVMHPELYYPNDIYWDFMTAADAMARLLGFYDAVGVVFWAGKNPEIWGNSLGDGMFSSPDAFGECETLHDIIEHLRAVADRLDSQPAVEIQE